MEVEVKLDKERKAFIAEVEGSEAYLEYEMRGSKMDFQHTYTPRELRGKGLAGKIVKFAFEYARENNLKVIPTCPYIGTFLAKNEEYKELVEY